MVAPLNCQPNSGVAFAAASLWGLARRLPVLAFFFPPTKMKASSLQRLDMIEYKPLWVLRAL